MNRLLPSHSTRLVERVRMRACRAEVGSIRNLAGKHHRYENAAGTVQPALLALCGRSNDGTPRTESCARAV